MNKYLVDLFKDENTVIIPGLGALTVVNRATSELMFMSYLKHNDGTLVKYIAQQEGIDADAALDKVSRFVDEVKATLDNRGVFELEQIGTFSKDNSGDIQYDPIASEIQEGKKESIAEEVKTEAVSVADTIKEEIREIEEEVSETVEQLQDEVSNTVSEIEETVEKTELEIEERVEESIAEIKEEVVIPEPEMKEVFSEEPAIIPMSEQEQWNDDLDLPPLNYQAERPKKPILEKTKKDKKPRRYSLLWILLALVIMGGAAYVGFNYNDLKEKIPFLASAKEKEKVNEEESSVENEAEEPTSELAEEDTEVIASEEEFTEDSAVEGTEVREKPKPAVSSSGLIVDKSLPVQVIVGSFGEESNAVRLVDKLRSQGFPAEVIGVYGGLHTVSVASFNSMDEYKANQSQLQSAGAHWVKR